MSEPFFHFGQAAEVLQLYAVNCGIMVFGMTNHILQIYVRIRYNAHMKSGVVRFASAKREENTAGSITAATGGRGNVYHKERKCAEWVGSSVPIFGKAAAYEDTLPDNENCSNGIVP